MRTSIHAFKASGLNSDGKHQLRFHRALLLLLAGGILALLPLPSANAQEHLGTNVAMRADIPFQFTVGERVLPAGKYLVHFDRSTRAIVLENATDYTSISTAAKPAYRKENDIAKGRLEFNQYGTAQVLKKIWLNGESKGSLILETKRERELAKLAAPTPVHTASVISE